MVREKRQYCRTDDNRSVLTRCNVHILSQCKVYWSTTRSATCVYKSIILPIPRLFGMTFSLIRSPQLNPSICCLFLRKSFIINKHISPVAMQNPEPASSNVLPLPNSIHPPFSSFLRRGASSLSLSLSLNEMLATPMHCFDLDVAILLCWEICQSCLSLLR